MKIISSKITEALEFCAFAHKDQKRKALDIPYASHPSSVGFILYSLDYEEDVIIAGILHDIIEDTSFTEKDIKERFGEKVTNLVKGVTEDKSIESWMERKKNYLSGVKNGNDEVKAISAVDLFDNCRSMLRSLNEGVDMWGMFSISPEILTNTYKERLRIIGDAIKPELKIALEEIISKLEENHRK